MCINLLDSSLTLLILLICQKPPPITSFVVDPHILTVIPPFVSWNRAFPLYAPKMAIRSTLYSLNHRILNCQYLP